MLFVIIIIIYHYHGTCTSHECAILNQNLHFSDHPKITQYLQSPSIRSSGQARRRGLGAGAGPMGAGGALAGRRGEVTRFASIVGGCRWLQALLKVHERERAAGGWQRRSRFAFGHAVNECIVLLRECYMHIMQNKS